MKRSSIIYALVALVPLAMLCTGLFWAVQRHHQFESYKRAEGRVIELRINRLDNVLDKEQVYYPLIRYDDDKGVVHEFLLKVGYERPPWSVGEKIDLLFDPKHSDNALVDSFMHKWFGPTVVFVIGLVGLALVFTGWLVTLLGERKGRPS